MMNAVIMYGLFVASGVMLARNLQATRAGKLPASAMTWVGSPQKTEKIVR